MPQNNATETCRIKTLASTEVLKAAERAIKLNPANGRAVNALRMAAPNAVLTPENLAILTSKYWGRQGVHLTVGFLDNPDTALRKRILLHMNAWGKSANIEFVETNVDPQVRIARTAGDGYWSYVGTDILSIDKQSPTMNLDSFTMSTADAEFFRVVRHETGHTLGCPHEHMRQEIVDRIDRAKAIAYFKATQDWSEAMVVQQVLTALDDSALSATAHADPASIMCYWLPGSIMKDGQAVIGGRDIDAQDRAFIDGMYPKATGDFWHTLRRADGSWTGLGELNTQIVVPGPVRTVAGVAGAGGETHFMFATLDGHLWHTIRYADGSWQPLGDAHAVLGIAGSIVHVAAAAGLGGETQYMLTNAAGRLLHTIRFADGSWQPLGDAQTVIGIPAPVVDVAGTAGASGETHFMFTTTDGHLWHTVRKADGSWTGLGDVQTQISVSGPVRSIGAATGKAGETQFMFTTSDGHLWHTIRFADGSWQPTGDAHAVLGVGGPVGAVAAAAGKAGETQYMFTTSNGHVGHSLRRADGSWTGLGDVNGQFAIPKPVKGIAAATGSGGETQFVCFAGG